MRRADASSSSRHRPSVDAVARDDEPFAVGDGDHAGVEPLLEQVRLPLAQLPQQRAADVADADHHERERLARLEESLMDHVERARLLRGVHDAGDVALGRSLSDGADVDVVPPERPEHLAGDVRPSLHALADHGDDRLIGFPIERGEAVVKLEPEFLGDRLGGGRRRRPCSRQNRSCARRRPETSG